MLCYFSVSRYFFVSDTITLFSAIMAIRLGIAISPLNMSAIVQTAETVINGPINMHNM